VSGEDKTEKTRPNKRSRLTQTMAFREGTSGQNNITNYTDALSLTTTAGKRASSLTLPRNGNMHVLAITEVK